jgi:hypothetical protein
MISNELRELLISFVNNQIGINELESWIVPKLPALIQDPNSPDADIVAVIELALAEFAKGIRTEDDVRKYIHRTLQEHSLVWADYPNRFGSSISSGSANETVNHTLWTKSVEISYHRIK